MESFFRRALGRENTKGSAQDFSTGYFDFGWWNDRKYPEQIVKPHVGATVGADKFNRVLRLSGVRCLGIGIEEIGDVRIGNDAPDHARIHARDSMTQVKIGEFIVGISVEYNEVAISAELILNHRSQRDRIDQVEEKTKAGHQPAPDVLIAPIDRSLGAANAFVALEDSMASAFAEFCEPCNIIPKPNHTNSHSPFFKSGAQERYLCALSSAINA
jgi:hypothetical protein